MKFLVVIPTVRQALPGFEEAMAHVRASFTHPTEFHVLDGKPNKPETLNRAYDELLTPSDCDVYVTMDDDYLPGIGWQDTVARGIEAFPEVGAFGIWLGDTQDMLEVMGAYDIGPVSQRNGVEFRSIKPSHHIAGAMIAFRREAALAVGHQPASELNYQVWEDAWRCRRVRKAGWDLIYLVGETPTLINYADPPEYVEAKLRDLAVGRHQVHEFFQKGGVQDPFWRRLRHWAGRLKAKLFKPS